MHGAPWKRRGFLRAAGFAGLSTFIPEFAAHAMADGSEWSADFARALDANPMLLGWRSVSADRLDCEARVEGRLPAELVGTLYRNGPAVHERFGHRYTPLVRGATAWCTPIHFDGRRVSHRGRVVKTPKLAREDEAGRRLFPGVAMHIENGITRSAAPTTSTPPTSACSTITASCSPCGKGARRAVLDRDTLAWRGFKVWGERLEGLPFTAHPKVEPDRTLWAFGYSLAPAPALVLYHIGPEGGLRNVALVDAGPLGMVHDFVVTARHLVIVIPPLVFEPGPDRNLLLDALVWRPELGSRVLVVEKDDFSARRWYQLPAGFGFHHGNGWEDASGTIRFDHCVAADATLMSETMRFVMRGEFRRATPELYTRFALHPDGRAEVESTGEEAEFPRIAPSLDSAGAIDMSIPSERSTRSRRGLDPAPGGQAGPRARRRHSEFRLRSRSAAGGARIRASTVPARRGRRDGCSATSSTTSVARAAFRSSTPVTLRTAPSPVPGSTIPCRSASTATSARPEGGGPSRSPTPGASIPRDSRTRGLADSRTRQGQLKFLIFKVQVVLGAYRGCVCNVHFEILGNPDNCERCWNPGPSQVAATLRTG